jgi:hypothetical protein
LEATEWKLIQQLQLSNSATDEVAFLFVAKGLTQKMAQPEETEQLQIKKVSFDEAYRMVVEGIITDSLSVAAILKARLLLLENKL